MLDEQVADILKSQILRNGNAFSDQVKMKYQSLKGGFDLIPNQCNHIIRTLYQKFNIFLNILEQLSTNFELHCAHSKNLLIPMVYHYNDSHTPKETYASLTYSYMESYIAVHGNADANMKIYGELRLIGAGHKISYLTIKKWFLEKYPEIVEFGIDDVA